MVPDISDQGLLHIPYSIQELFILFFLIREGFLGKCNWDFFHNFCPTNS
jgi:hypothetical protein